jgi:hypothetical protein
MLMATVIVVVVMVRMRCGRNDPCMAVVVMMKLVQATAP